MPSLLENSFDAQMPETTISAKIQEHTMKSVASMRINKKEAVGGLVPRRGCNFGRISQSGWRMKAWCKAALQAILFLPAFVRAEEESILD